MRQLEELEKQRGAAYHAIAKASFAQWEMYARLWTGDADQTLKAVPRWCGVRNAFIQVGSGPSLVPLARAAGAWCPDVANVWMQRGRQDTRRERSADYQRVAFHLSGRGPTYALQFGQALLYQGRSEDVRNLASRCLARDDELARLAGEYLQARYEYSRGRLAACLRRCRKNLLAHQITPATTEPYHAMLVWAAETESLLEQHEVVDAALDHMLREGTAPAGTLSAAALAYAACHGSPKVAQRSLARVDDLLEEGKITLYIPGWRAALEGSKHYVAGQYKKAAAAWRPLVGAAIDEGRVAPEAFDRAGEEAIASKLDEKLLEWYGAVVTLADVRAARRALARGDVATAKRLAKRAVDAWETADIEVPAVAEMREIVRR